MRGVRRACPVCGYRKIFSTYFKLKDACPRCRYQFTREDGYWVGAVIINTAFTEVVFFLLFLGAVLATAPDVEWTTLLLIGIVTNVVFPVIFYPFSKTIWMAFDLVYMKRLER